jgi:hypothetical protein
LSIVPLRRQPVNTVGDEDDPAKASVPIDNAPAPIANVAPTFTSARDPFIFSSFLTFRHVPVRGTVPGCPRAGTLLSAARHSLDASRSAAMPDA